MRIKIKSFEEIERTMPHDCSEQYTELYLAYFDRRIWLQLCDLWLDAIDYNTSLLDGRNSYVVTAHPLSGYHRIYIPEWFVEEVIEDEN